MNKIFTFLPLLLSALLCSLISCGQSSAEAQELFLNPAPLPEYLTFVEPEPGELVTLAEFSEGLHYDKIVTPAKGSSNRICARLNIRVLLEPGDDFIDDQNMTQRVTLELGGRVLRMVDEIMVFPSVTTLFNEQGISVARGYSGELYCWPLDPRQQVYVATLSIAKTSGQQVSYSWSFRVNN